MRRGHVYEAEQTWSKMVEGNCGPRYLEKYGPCRPSGCTGRMLFLRRYAILAGERVIWLAVRFYERILRTDNPGESAFCKCMRRDNCTYTSGMSNFEHCMICLGIRGGIARKKRWERMVPSKLCQRRSVERDCNASQECWLVQRSVHAPTKLKSNR